MSTFAPAATTTPNADEPQFKSVRARGTWQTRMTTDVSIRDFEFRTDEPEPAGGTNSAPTPMEFIAGALNGCITVVIESVAAELNLSLRALDTASHAHMDVRGFHGTADVSPHFHDYALTIQIDVDADDSQRAELVRLSEKRCPAINLVRDAGVDFTIDWQFVQAAQVPVVNHVSATQSTGIEQ
ncbi:OsmC family protein [Paramicrobacterium chengjingii]|uniref:OsmC family protein n=1 Tax=Paramicrobacterium chengjingii TaxID=2769067 RepID=A0ABX6YHH1_9MICO|nr:OsmC family protein [Microbacterium chengjingii]QPZ38044.1 OsmC family protein [Microbacterium chengjingii]